MPRCPFYLPFSVKLSLDRPTGMCYLVARGDRSYFVSSTRDAKGKEFVAQVGILVRVERHDTISDVVGAFTKSREFQPPLRCSLLLLNTTDS